MNREVHVRVWERAEVKFLRATRHNPKGGPKARMSAFANTGHASEMLGLTCYYDTKWL
jgi:hypothetical protein